MGGQQITASIASSNVAVSVRPYILLLPGCLLYHRLPDWLWWCRYTKATSPTTPICTHINTHLLNQLCCKVIWERVGT